jgi:hypothetical protein
MGRMKCIQRQKGTDTFQGIGIEGWLIQKYIFERLDGMVWIGHSDYIPMARCYIFSRSVEVYNFIKGGVIVHYVLHTFHGSRIDNIQNTINVSCTVCESFLIFQRTSRGYKECVLYIFLMVLKLCLLIPKTCDCVVNLEIWLPA